MRAVRSLILFSMLALMLGAPACTRVRPSPGDLPKGLEGWKRQCGLLWVLTARDGDRIRIRITGKDGGLVDYGTGFLVDERRLASAFCRTDHPGLAGYHCVLESEGGAPFSGRLEAWYQGGLLRAWDIPSTRHFDALAVLPR